ncbi:MAG: TRAP transporter substrate-binding protein DctP [Alphaproteobacteria bacterium]|nr:TRAP transporter substrate-binding protein DctP [Alphaproteobacteria bacterium]
MTRTRSLWLSLALALAAQPLAAAEHNWRFFTYVSPTDFHAKMNKAFAEDITRASGGRLEIAHFGAGELPYKAGDIIKAVATNQIQMGQVGAGLAAGDAPEIDVFSLPFLCTSYPQFAAAAKAMGDVPDQVLTRKFGVRVVMNWPIPGQNIWTTAKLERIADLKGKKIRTWNPLQVDMLQQIGANPVSLDPAEVVPALQRKVVDGAITSALSANDWKAYDIVKFGLTLNFTMAHQITLANAEALKKLPADLQKLIADKSAEWAPRYFEASEAADRAALDTMRGKGVTITVPPADEVTAMKASLRPMWAKWSEKNGPVAADLLARVSAACR